MASGTQDPVGCTASERPASARCRRRALSTRLQDSADALEATDSFDDIREERQAAGPTKRGARLLM